MDERQKRVSEDALIEEAIRTIKKVVKEDKNALVSEVVTSPELAEALKGKIVYTDPSSTGEKSAEENPSD